MGNWPERRPPVVVNKPKQDAATVELTAEIAALRDELDALRDSVAPLLAAFATASDEPEAAPAPPVMLSELTKAELLAYATDKLALELNPRTNKEALIEAIVAAAAERA